MFRRIAAVSAISLTLVGGISTTAEALPIGGPKTCFNNGVSIPCPQPTYKPGTPVKVKPRFCPPGVRGEKLAKYQKATGCVQLRGYFWKRPNVR